MRLFIFVTVCFCFIALSIADDTHVCTKKRVFVNYDDTHFAYSREKNGIVPDENEIRGLVRKYKGTDVSDLVFCIGGRIADVPNGAKESWCDKYHQTRENGQDVCYTNHYLRLYREIYEVRKLDPYALWLDEAHKIGIRPWLSFRMNDCHETFKPTSFLHPNFFHEHPECRRIRHRTARGYYDNCFDYSCAAVRERELAFIAEMLERYDTDGVELDWMREAYCFQPGCESAATITAFTRSVRELADKAAKRFGHPVQVMARVPTDPETALRFGFDVASWADEKLVDVIVPSPRWSSTDNELPTDIWKRLLRGSGVTLAPGLELRIMARTKGACNMLTDQVVGTAAAFYSAGADGLYLYNYFDDPGWEKAETRMRTRYGQPVETLAVHWPNQLKWLAFIGQPDRVLAAPRDHMLTYRDLVPIWESPRRPFPVTAAANAEKPTAFRLVTGKVSAGRKLTLRLGVKGGRLPGRVFVNSRLCTYLGNEACVPAFTDDPLCCYDVPPYEEEAALVEVAPDEEVELSHLDLQVRVPSENRRWESPVAPAKAADTSNPLAGISFDVPQMWPCKELTGPGHTAIWLQGEHLKGNPTRVFAYVVLPEGASAEHKVPGVVLAHGGLGTAYLSWAETWAKHGYAAIVPDTCGAMPVRITGEKRGDLRWARTGVGGPHGWGRYDLANEAPCDQWPYHAVGALVRCHSYLRALPEVDADKTGLVGISWGGFLTMLTAAQDTRFKFAIPVYTCAFFDEMEKYGVNMGRVGVDRGLLDRWEALFDPKHYVPKMTMPAMWFASSNDVHFPFDLLQRTAELLPQRAQLAIRVRMAHTHGPLGENMPELFRFANSIVRGGQPLPVIEKPCVADGQVCVRFDAKGQTFKRFDLNWCTNAVPVASSEWLTKPYPVPKGDIFSAPLPTGATRIYVNAVLEGDTGEEAYPEALVSSPALVVDCQVH